LGSLTAHLLEDGDHGRLGFHSRCPVCRRERVFGSLLSEPVVSRRVKAAVAAGAFAFSVAAPGIAAAQERDREQEGVVAPTQSMGAAPEQQRGGVADELTFDPGDDDESPLEVGTPEAAPPADQDADYPVEPGPVDDTYADDLAPGESDSEAYPSEEAPAPLVEAAPKVPAPPSDPVSVESPTTEAGTPATPDARDKSEPRRDTKSSDTPKAESEKPRKTDGHSGIEQETTPKSPPVVPSRIAPAADAQLATPSPAALPATSSSTTPASTSVDSTAGSTSTAEATGAPSNGDVRFHVVRPGESLWSIAKKLLGPSASPAQIAREVNRLWELNKDRIGTGNPDLLMAGTKLRLR
jgi:LysM domain